MRKNEIETEVIYSNNVGPAQNITTKGLRTVYEEIHFCL